MITIIGDLVVDIVVSAPEINYATDSKGNIELAPGGQANNVARWINYEKAPCELIGRIGSDPLGRYLQDYLDEQGISSRVEVDEKAQTGKIVVLVDHSSKERSMITDRGANLNLQLSQVEKLEATDLLYLSGYSLFEEDIARVIKQAKNLAVKNNIPVALDPSSTYYLRRKKDEFLDFLQGVTYLFPNEEEGELLTGEQDPERILYRLKEYVPHPILTMGARGVFYLDDSDKIVHVPGKKVDVKDTTGAGDAFCGTFLANVQKNGNKKYAVERAIENSSRVVQSFGAGPDELE